MQTLGVHGPMTPHIQSLPLPSPGCHSFSAWAKQIQLFGWWRMAHHPPRMGKVPACHLLRASTLSRPGDRSESISCLESSFS